jgi:hypothetical protein
MTQDAFLLEALRLAKHTGHVWREFAEHKEIGVHLTVANVRAVAIAIGHGSPPQSISFVTGTPYTAKLSEYLRKAENLVRVLADDPHATTSSQLRPGVEIGAIRAGEFLFAVQGLMPKELNELFAVCLAACCGVIDAQQGRQILMEHRTHWLNCFADIDLNLPRIS